MEGSSTHHSDDDEADFVMVEPAAQPEVNLSADHPPEDAIDVVPSEGGEVRVAFCKKYRIHDNGMANVHSDGIQVVSKVVTGLSTVLSLAGMGTSPSAYALHS